MKKITIALIAGMLVCCVAGCGGGGGGVAAPRDQKTATIAVPPGGSTPSATTMSLANATATLPAGTTLKDVDGNVVSGTVTASVTFSNQTNDLPSAANKTVPQGTGLVSFLDIQLKNDSGTVVKELDQPMVVNVKAPGTKPGDLVIHYSFNGVSWVAEESTTVKSDGTVDILITHFSDHAIFQYKKGSEDTTPPDVKSITPSNHAVNVALNSKIMVVFTEAIAESTINTGAGTFKVSAGGNAVSGTVSFDKATNAATFTTTDPAGLNPNTRYDVTITTGVKDLSGNALAAAEAYYFTTGPAVDTTAPTVKTVTPASGATGVSVDAKLSIVFSEAMDPSTVKDNLIKDLPGTVTYNPANNTATFTPSNSFANGKEYEFTVQPKAKDLAGNLVAAKFTWRFTTLGTTGTTGGTGGTGTGAGF